ncbi:PAP2 superfamily protein [Pontibacter ummariensis]|uniref:PAP2 superfamily protein n=1 Tax=Pontibacter ummariensis TaxID=1610492 RepID=A0A239HE04_9BACT|nr:phosphatase PAP2 family protein [Pontibacter ummariensis]PRY10626.1 PAP2 superfamily protein [Pontibacter ummariensis]SNS79666.1 PAP2 superfamily protein [Pontibacter ummariensis]
MKKHLALILSGFCLCLLASCDKDVVESNAGYPALDPANIDADAGSWAPMVVSSAAAFSLPAPQPTSSAAYQQELQELKELRSSLTEEQKRVINYWKVGSVVRWNEIMRELVAKHNLPPYQNPDNTYPVPSAANPFAYPTFPFSNPPYAARAYAYVSVAQYDALVMAHYFKEKYKRPAPYQVDAAIKPAVPESALAAYPSEDAVIAGASLEMMKLLFPGDVAYLTGMAEEEKNYRLWSGANVRSDIIAGDSLGRWAARMVIQRAKADGMGAAGGNQEVWARLENDCKARGETPWYSLEVPKRPPMLPLFGEVKPLLFDKAEVPALRPGPPPSANSEQMRKELEEVLSYTRNATREQMRIVNFWADGVGTYTPPGHWNAIATESFVKKQYSEVRWARNYALLNAALMDAAILCWNTKYYYYNARPCQLDPRIKTLTGVPNFPAYISGHSTFSGAAATTLGYLIPEKAGEFQKMAQEASNSRLFGGIHYRADCTVGLETGQKVGYYAIARARTDGAD